VQEAVCHAAKQTLNSDQAGWSRSLSITVKALQFQQQAHANINISSLSMIKVVGEL